MDSTQHEQIDMVNRWINHRCCNLLTIFIKNYIWLGIISGWLKAVSAIYSDYQLYIGLLKADFRIFCRINSDNRNLKIVPLDNFDGIG